ncbi:hypothetical protein A3F07_02985 [candidate division WWE3 bacterium RIFCSPHIGHO2_12_FULL_38_15]|uniref:Uncharacterized protein n=1 Tax=candidate division WWE3 bacterium RIFCSPHIGHO2_02_FULL_38_14 TaxID=1802620 RepID=A0A1F4VAG4_UNCKA|nr:MAG: hypothetical protein A2793_01475 [candidate division WWE3 bacterium RIFCSPHIGHO2_01_FULL_38_45]OGC49437.1 MAG: hypothetical protein A3F07_02985 [candidate division WWE3 bacterium RIFCSPHIGHO2_12_FULL_38_15]OGC52753.1 MAG: hypothetical protein A3B64_01090 [candidate division WWE3 bacterium RIFCSPLOWO2_01_FULL_37_24]OGC53880.1 MAG: hypothetical protein A3D91_01445 [candidate division WWE3 bacterium RIFCSPHIGHO2_02_FULL_38_14]HLB52045.1 hypothetical protein [Patescibacteria group bacterium
MNRRNAMEPGNPLIVVMVAFAVMSLLTASSCGALEALCLPMEVRRRRPSQTAFIWLTVVLLVLRYVMAKPVHMFMSQGGLMIIFNTPSVTWADIIISASVAVGFVCVSFTTSSKAIAAWCGGLAMFTIIVTVAMVYTLML